MENSHNKLRLTVLTVLYSVLFSILYYGVHNIYGILNMGVHDIIYVIIGVIIVFPIPFFLTFLFPAFVWIVSLTNKESYYFKYIVNELLETLLLKRYIALIWMVIVLFFGHLIIAFIVRLIIAAIFIVRIYRIIKNRFDFSKVKFWIIVLAYAAFSIVIAI